MCSKCVVNHNLLPVATIFNKLKTKNADFTGLSCVYFSLNATGLLLGCEPTLAIEGRDQLTFNMLRSVHS